ALFSNTTGNSNNAFGPAALTSNTTGGANEAVGDGALHQNSTGSNNIALGVEAGVNITDANHVICIGTAGANPSGVCFIGNILGATSGLGTSVLINSDGQLGTMTSPGALKKRSNRWSGPAMRSLHSNRLHSATKRRSTHSRFHSLG